MIKKGMETMSDQGFADTEYFSNRENWGYGPCFDATFFFADWVEDLAIVESVLSDAIFRGFAKRALDIDPENTATPDFESDDAPDFKGDDAPGLCLMWAPDELAKPLGREILSYGRQEIVPVRTSATYG